MDSNEKNLDLLDLLCQKLQIKDSSHPVLTEFSSTLSKLSESPSFPYTFTEILLKNLVFMPFLSSFKSKILEEIEKTIEKSALSLHSKISDIEEKCLGLEHRIESTKKKFGGDVESTQRKLTEIQSYLSTKPWVKEITPIFDQINEKPSFEDLYSIKVNIEPKFEELKNLSITASENIKDFEGALARLDEILLTKASKDDIRYLNTQFDCFITKSNFEKVFFELNFKIEELEKIEKDRKDQLFDLQNDGCSKASHRNTSKDFSILFNKVSAISTILDSKIDKIEVLPLIQSNEVKDITLKRQIDGLLADLQQIAVFSQEILKTMMRSLDSAEKKNKQRSEIFKALEKLVSNLTLKISENKIQASCKSANFARNSQSPDMSDRIIATNLSRNSNRKSTRQVFVSKSNKVSINL